MKKHFENLENRFYCFFHSFSGYDGPVQLPYLAKATKDLNIHPMLKVSRQGSRIKHLSFGGFVFLDSITSFLGQPTSLQKMSITCEVAKENSAWLEKVTFLNITLSHTYLIFPSLSRVFFLLND